MLDLSPNRKALMEAVITAPLIDLACMVCCQFNYSIPVHMTAVFI